MPFAFLGLAIELVSVAYFSPRFQIRRVQIEGNRVARAEDLLDRIDVKKGTALAKISPKALAMQLDAEPAIESVSVERRLPDTVAIHVTERKPAWNVKTPRGWRRADESGVVFHRVAQPLEGLPNIAIEGSDLEPGQSVPPAILRAAQQCVRWTCRQRSLAVRCLQIDGHGKFTIEMNSGVSVQLGSPFDLGAKLDTLTRLAEEIPELTRGENIEYVNLVASDAPAIRYREFVRLSG